MGIPDSSLLNLFVKVKSWLSWGVTDLSPSRLPQTPIRMSDYSVNNMCGECGTELYCRGCFCQSCGRVLCGQCIGGYGSVASDVIGSNDGYRRNGDASGESIKACKLCYGVEVRCEAGRKNNGEKVHPSESFRDSPEPSSPSYSGDLIHGDRLAHYLEFRDCGYSPNAMARRSSFSAHPSPVSVRHFTTSRSDEEEAEEAGRFYSPPSEYYHDNFDIDSNSVSARLEFYGSKSVGSSPLDSPSRIDFNSCRVGRTIVRGQEGSPLSRASGPFYQESMAVLGKPDKGAADPDNTDDCSDDMSISHNQFDKSQMPLDFESNGMIWSPPLPEDENDEADGNFLTYEDDDDDGGDSCAIFSSSSSLSSTFPLKDKDCEGNKEPLKSVIQAHFRALVSQLLQGDDVKLCKDDDSEDWLDIVTTIAWQAATFVKPDTSKGGLMDPGNYVKVKCVASGNPRDSTLVKGVVCTKNIKHKRMTTQYKTPRLLLLGGALENKNVVSHLASFNTLVQQENDHLKMIISKIEALRPNVLLVEKSVSPYAQEYLLAKDISLVLNVRKSLLERIAQCTGALIGPSIDNISTTRLGHCELFHVEKVTEEHETISQSNRKPSKTLMFFEGCPRRLGCTILLKGACRDQLKKIKHVVQLAVFAAYHLSLETSFLADEGARLPKMSLKQAVNAAEKSTDDNDISIITPTNFQEVADASDRHDGTVDLKPEFGSGLSTDQLDSHNMLTSEELVNAPFAESRHDNEASTMEADMFGKIQSEGLHVANFSASQGMMTREDMLTAETPETMKSERIEDDEVSSEYFAANDAHLSILVSFSSRHVPKGTVCERSLLMRIKFYGSFDKPLGMYLRDDLFDQTSCCRYCNEPAEAHVLCYTHQQGNLTINVKSLSSMKLPGEKEGKIWMWHRCLRCALVDGVLPTTRRVVMSDAAWKLSFGKFLELSFSNHATANRVAPCGHSLQRDCLRFYGFGSMVAFFRYSPVDILNVHLPPSVLEFNGHLQQEWIRKEAAELLGHMETFYAEISDKLDEMELKCRSFGSKFPDKNEIENHIVELKDKLKNERNEYSNLLQLAILEGPHQDQIVDILELNQLRRSLLIDSRVWDRQLYSLDSLLKTTSVVNATQKDASFVQGKDLRREILLRDRKLEFGTEDGYGYTRSQMLVADDLQSEQTAGVASERSPEDLALPSCQHNGEQEVLSDDDASNLSERIDSAWTGTDHLAHASQDETVRQVGISDNPPFKRMMAPIRVQSFDSALKVQEMLCKGVAPMSTIRSFHASGDYRSMVRDPVSNTLRTYSQALPLEGHKSSSIFSSGPSFISSASDITGGARLLLPERGGEDIVISVFDNDLASIVSYALTSKDYDDWIIDKVNDNERTWSTSFASSGTWSTSFASSTLSPWQSFGSVDMDHMRFGSEDPSLPVSTLSTDPKKSLHLTISYEDDSSKGDKVKFTVTCYFARQFDSLRKKCCPSEVDFVRSLSRCQKWSAQGGKSNVYFAKSMDERFIIKQVTKTELESFEKFAPEYFKYLTAVPKSGSPTCLAKILGIYQVSVKHLKGGKESKMDVMVMENLFFRRNISRVYDLKGSIRSRYNPDTSSNNVLLDMNLVETLRTEPIFLGSKAKRNLERAIWNDTSFLASVDVMDYSLLVGVDVERKELVLGIIDFMRQYTWDKQLETWVKKSGILGGPKNASPTIVSPKQYKKRFRKAMTSYFLTVPDQWSS